MILGQIEQQGINDGRICSCSIEKSVFDGVLCFRIVVPLNCFQNAKHPAQVIGNILTVLI